MIYVKYIKIPKNKSRAEAAALRHKAGRSLLAFALNEEYGIDESGVLFGKDGNGKPVLENHGEIHFNISHSGNYAAVVLSEYECGIDIEDLNGKSRSQNLARRICSDEELARLKDCQNPERELLRLWTLKESYVKATGRGIGFGLSNAQFSFDNNGISANVGGEYQQIENNRFIISVCIIKK